MTSALTESDLLARQAQRESNARTYPRHQPFAPERALGAEITSVDGRRYLDFCAGAGVLAVGHNHPRVVEAVKSQLERLVHALDFPTPTRDEFVTELFETLPEGLKGRMRVHIAAPTGSDAVEAALKLCKRATGRTGVVAFQGSYHGTTAGALSVTALREVKEKIGAMMPEVSFSPYSYCGRCPLKLTRSVCKTACAASFETLLFDTHSGVPTPAAAIVEFLQGEGGGIVPTRDFAERVRRATLDAGVPLIADEIQAGFGRTGRFWSFEHFGVEPDVIVTSKGLGGIGLPLAAVLYRRELDVWEPGSHIGTFRGHQLGMAAGTAAMRVIREEGLIENARLRGAELMTGLSSLPSSTVSEVRGLGLMIAIEFADPISRAPLPELAKDVKRRAFEQGLLCELGGRNDSTLRLLPPLVITAAHVTQALEILERSMRESEKNLPRA